MWIVNGYVLSNFNIPLSKQIYTLVSYWLVFFTLLVSYLLAFTFFNTSADISHTVHIMKVPRRSTLHVLDVLGKFAIYSTIGIMKALSLLLSAFTMYDSADIINVEW